jgi:hypothetical protein
MHSRASIELLCLQWLGVDGLIKTPGRRKVFKQPFRIRLTTVMPAIKYFPRLAFE